MTSFTDLISKAGKVVHMHKWEYGRHNALIIRSCYCTATEQGTIEEEPELRSTAPIRRRYLDKIVWKHV